MNTKINFVNRDQLIKNNENPKKVDAQKIIDYFLSLHRMNRLIVGSPLYNLAVSQYNENIKNTLVRPPVPQWFCGKVNIVTGDLLVTPSDEQTRATSGLVLDPANPAPPPTPNIQGQYNVDECLEIGLPGSTDYATCKTGQDARQADDAIAEWQTSFEAVNAELEALKAEVAAAEAAAEAEAEAAAAAGSSSSGGGVNVFEFIGGAIVDFVDFVLDPLDLFGW